LEDFGYLVIDDEKIIVFMFLVLLYFEEMVLKFKKGSDVLFDCFDVKGVSDIIELGRVNVVRKCFGLF
ncbi:suppressor of fused domain protein, partial [Xanthomonas citri pv. citri]|nr:suppressor of fused domain protein [Xanthomonas citri pv. citri]